MFRTASDVRALRSPITKLDRIPLMRCMRRWRAAGEKNINTTGLRKRNPVVVNRAGKCRVQPRCFGESTGRAGLGSVKGETYVVQGGASCTRGPHAAVVEGSPHPHLRLPIDLLTGALAKKLSGKQGLRSLFTFPTSLARHLDRRPTATFARITPTPLDFFNCATISARASTA